MHLILIIIGLLLLLLLIPILVIGIVAYAKLMSIWHKLTGKQPSNDGPHFTFTSSFGSRGRQSTGNQETDQRSQQTTSQQHSSQYGPTKKIFSDNEGEYVDFEVVD